MISAIDNILLGTENRIADRTIEKFIWDVVNNAKEAEVRTKSTNNIHYLECCLFNIAVSLARK